METKASGDIQQFQALQKIGSTMGFSTLIEADKMANLALSMAMEFTGATRGSLLLYSSTGGSRYRFGVDPSAKEHNPAPSEGVLERMERARTSRKPARGKETAGGPPYLCVPMVVEEDVVGVLYLGRSRGRPAFEERELGLAEMAAGQLGMSITARFLYEQMTEKRKQVELIDKISKAVSAPGSLKKVLALVVETGRQALRAEGAALVLADDDGEFGVRFSDGLHAVGLDPAGDGVSARLIRDAIEKGKPRMHAAAEPMKGLSSAVAVPVKLSLRDQRVFNERRRSSRRAPASKVLGALYVEGRAGLEEFTEDDQFVLQVFADHITTALTKDNLYQQASTDGLTGLASRRYLDRRLADEMAFATRNGTPLSILLVDLDDFKQLNDTHGHQAGDEVLRAIGKIIRKSVRRVDVCGRYGGEEFILALPETETDGALVVAENVRERVEAHDFVDPQAALRVTVTLGIATFPTHAADLHALIGAADRAMYEGKRAGKNRHQVAKSP